MPRNSNLPGHAGALQEATVSVSVLASCFPMSGEYLPAYVGVEEGWVCVDLPL